MRDDEEENTKNIETLVYATYRIARGVSQGSISCGDGKFKSFSSLFTVFRQIKISAIPP